jgi:hypothetical protein
MIGIPFKAESLSCGKYERATYRFIGSKTWKWEIYNGHIVSPASGWAVFSNGDRVVFLG